MQINLPKYVSESDRGYVWRPYEGMKNGKPQFGKRQVIAPSGASEEAVWRAWQAVSADVFTVGWLLREYHDSAKFKRLSPKTQSDYETYRKSLCETQIDGGVFARAELSNITKRTIRGYLDSYPHPVAANRRIAYFKAAWNWAEERHEIPANPCLKVTMNEETPRDRFVTDEEYMTVYKLACPELRQLMELAYLCRARWGEVMSLKVEHITEDGLVLNRTKGSEGEVTMWSERLRDAVSEVRGGEYICHRYTKSAFSSAWRRLMARAEKAGVDRYTYHDLKARGVSCHPTQWSGHRSGAMRKVYVRKLQLVKPTSEAALKIAENC